MHDSIRWADNKDVDLLYSILPRDDPDFFMFFPNSSDTFIGWEPFERYVEEIYLDDAFRTTGYEVTDLRINISDSGNVAWFSAILYDSCEYHGIPHAWVDVRWTGVLEKRDGNWVIVQMHFSAATDAAEADDSEGGPTDE